MNAGVPGYHATVTLNVFLMSLTLLYLAKWFLIVVTRRVLRFFRKIQLKLKIIEKGVKREKKLE